MSLIFRNVEVSGRRCDVCIEGPTVIGVGNTVDSAQGDVVDGRGGALLPGLHDHHVHILAMAAADRSVQLAGLAADAASPMPAAEPPSG